jgi:ribosome-associated protein
MTNLSDTTSEAAAKKDVQRLQRAIVDGLEDVKAQDIVVFNTEKLSPLFERVIIASGTSNRQTKALASSVRDAVREAGFGKPRSEGEENGEWIIVDCHAVVVHIMQPAIRTYYNLEEIWGDTPVRLKFGAPKPVVAQPEKKAGKVSGKKAPIAGKKTAQAATKKIAAKKTGASGAVAKKAAPKAAPKSAPRPAAKKVVAKKAAAKKPAAKKVARKRA